MWKIEKFLIFLDDIAIANVLLKPSSQVNMYVNRGAVKKSNKQEVDRPKKAYERVDCRRKCVCQHIYLGFDLINQVLSLLSDGAIAD